MGKQFIAAALALFEEHLRKKENGFESIRWYVVKGFNSFQE